MTENEMTKKVSFVASLTVEVDPQTNVMERKEIRSIGEKDPMVSVRRNAVSREGKAEIKKSVLDGNVESIGIKDLLGVSVEASDNG
jgi:hypothetical protein